MYKEELRFFMKRRSIRSYQDRPVEEEKVEFLLKAATTAPSACNTQPCKTPCLRRLPSNWAPYGLRMYDGGTRNA